MKKLTKLLDLDTDEQLFEYFIKNLNLKGITQWDYYVNWQKVYSNVCPFEKELNLLNFLVGKQNIEEELSNLIVEYPKVINAIPLLLAIRFKKKSDQKFYILSDLEKYEYLHFDLTLSEPDEKDAKTIASFFMNSGLGELLRNKKIKNLVDYATGVEVGLDSNGRKNRGGHQMENLVEVYVKDACKKLNLTYLKEATAKTIKQHWDIDIAVDKSSRRIDFVINNKGKLFFIEVNFYNGGGSKLKSTATEYVKMNEYWNKQGIEFIWITDGAGWLKTQRPLREYFDKAEYLLNVDLLKLGLIYKVISK
jgi:type II restriction enzyme